MTYKIFTLGYLQTNCAVLEKHGSCVVIDAAFDASELCDYIVSRKLTLEAVLLTHGHFDHCGGVRQLLRGTDSSVPVFVNEHDAQLCKTASSNIWRLPAENCDVTNFVREGALNIGNFEFAVLETPGHTAGSVCYTIENLLFSGDTLMKCSIGRTDFRESVPSKMGSSLGKLAALSCDCIVIPGHGETTSLKFEKQNNPFLKQ